MKLVDLGPADAELVNFAPVTVSITTSLEGGRVKATLTPRTTLTFGHRYQVIVTQGIIDMYPNSSATCSAESPRCPGGLLPWTGNTAPASTKVPQLYDLDADQITVGRGAKAIPMALSAKTRAGASSPSPTTKPRDPRQDRRRSDLGLPQRRPGPTKGTGHHRSIRYIDGNVGTCASRSERQCRCAAVSGREKLAEDHRQPANVLYHRFDLGLRLRARSAGTTI